MKILYSQANCEDISALEHFGIKNCYLKQLHLNRDKKSVTAKLHHHTGFELHIIDEGYQIYEINGNRYKIEKSEFLLIYPNVSHRTVNFAENTKKYSLTFSKEIVESHLCFFGKVAPRICDNINFIINESLNRKEISSVLIENSVLESIVLLLRMARIRENPQNTIESKNYILDLAKLYINDNIEQNLSVSDVATHCHLSSKQLTRIFCEYEEITPAEYIKNQRINIIEQLLQSNELSLNQISEKLNFSNIYYFNAYFKKRNGMPPGEYRKMIGK